MNYTEMADKLGKSKNNSFGILVGVSTSQIIIYTRNTDIAIGDLFLIFSDGTKPRIYIFRISQYSNLLRVEAAMNPKVKSELIIADDFEGELLQLTGILFGYCEKEAQGWGVRLPRGLPEHLSKVYKIGWGNARHIKIQQECLRELLQYQLEGGIYIGDFLAGETSLDKVPVSISTRYIADHLGIFGRSGSGKSNQLMVLIRSICENNRYLQTKKEKQQANQRMVSLFSVDPYDEFAEWKQKILDSDSKWMGQSRQIIFHRRDIIPDDLFSIMEFSEQITSVASAIADEQDEEWISAILNGAVEPDERVIHRDALAALNRRLIFLAGNRSSFIPKNKNYISCLADIILALEHGRVLIIDTSLITEIEQFLLITIVARVVFSLRKALKASQDMESFLGGANSNRFGQGELDRHLKGMASFKNRLKTSLARKDSPYLDNGKIVSLDKLPVINIVVEDAAAILHPARMKFGSVFRDILRQGRKFGISLTIISRRITEIDPGILSCLNTKIILALGNEEERKTAIQNGGLDICGFKRELQVMGVGQAILTTSYKSMPLSIQIPEFS